MILVPIIQAAVLTSVVVFLALRGGIPHLRSPHKGEYRRVTNDLPMRERRRLARLGFARAPIRDPDDERRAHIIVRHVLASEAFKSNAWNWLWLGVGALSAAVAIGNWWDPEIPGEHTWIMALNALIFLSQGAWNMWLRSALRETARVNGWTLPTENREVRPPLPKGSG